MKSSGVVHMTADQAERFTAECSFRRLGPLLVGRLAAGGFSLTRQQAIADHIGQDHVFINIFLGGRGNGFCGGRSMALEAGALAISKLSSAAEYHLEDIAWGVIVAPRRLLQGTIGALDAMDGRVYKPGSAEALIVGAHIEALLALPADVSPSKAVLASRSSLALLGACLNPGAATVQATPSALAAAADGETKAAIRTYIEDNLADPALGPASICRHFALSRSRLYRLMQDAGSVAAVIRHLRLSRAYRDIAAGRLDDAATAAIAASFGFTEERSFRRAFTQAFGVSPAALRMQRRRGSRTTLPAIGATIEHWLRDL